MKKGTKFGEINTERRKRDESLSGLEKGRERSASRQDPRERCISPGRNELRHPGEGTGERGLWSLPGADRHGSSGIGDEISWP